MCTTYDYQLPDRGVGKIIDRLYGEMMMVKDLETSLQNLKTLVEQEHPLRR